MFEEHGCALHLLEKVAMDTTFQTWAKDKDQAKREQGDSRAGISSEGMQLIKGGKFEFKGSKLRKGCTCWEETLWSI